MDEARNDELTQLVESQLDAISEYVWAQKAPIWGDSSGRIVDAERVDELLNNVSTCLPEDIRCANSVLREAQNIKDPDPKEYVHIVEDYNCVRRWDAAPELPGAMQFGTSEK